MPTDESRVLLHQQYEARFTDNADFRDAVWKVLCNNFFAKYIPVAASVLDLGCGWGEFVNNISAKLKYGMDLNRDASSHLRPDVHFIHRDCSETWPIDSNHLDVVFTSNFLEHLPDRNAVERTIAESFRCLRPGGKLICMCPNIRYVGGAYWDFWDHQLPLTELSVVELFRLTGFSINEVYPQFLPYSMSQGQRVPVFLMKIYLNMPLLWRFFGKQFLVVAEKPGGRKLI